MPNDNIMGIPTRACINGFTKKDTERLKNALVKQILNDDTVVNVTEDGKIIVANDDGLFLSFDDSVIGLTKDDDDNVIPVADPYIPMDADDNPLAPANNVIMTSANIAVDPRIVHTTGNETVVGAKQGDWRGYQMVSPNPSTSGKWLRYAILENTYIGLIIEMFATRANNGLAYGIALIGGGGGGFQRSASGVNAYPTPYSNPVVSVINTTTGKLELWIYVSDINQVKEINFFVRYGNHLLRFSYPQTVHDTISNADNDTYGTQVVILGQVNP